MHSIVEDYFQALGEHQLQQALNCLSRDFELLLAGAGSEGRMDRDQMAGLLEWDMAIGIQLDIDDIRVEERQVLCIIREANQVLRLLGIDWLRSENLYTIGDDELIRRQRFRPLENQASYQEQMGKALKWLSENQPDKLAQVTREGRPVFAASLAEQWIALLTLWREAR